MNLILSETNIFAEKQWFDHGIFFEFRDCRLGTVLLDWKNPRHIGSRHNLWGELAILKPPPEEGQEFFLRLRIVFRLPDHRIPFIDYEHKPLSIRLPDDTQKIIVQTISILNLESTLCQIL